VKKHGIVFCDSATSNNREIEIPFVSFFSLDHLLGPTQCNKNKLLPNYNRQDVGPYMLSINPIKNIEKGDMCTLMGNLEIL
jgi:hypothetical protein